ncbi:Cytoskeleton associated protein 5, partial [Bonamia ostreae]
MALNIFHKTKQTEQLLKILEQIGLKSKKPIVVSSTVKLLKLILERFGDAKIGRPFYKEHIESIFMSTNLQVRKEALELAKEMFKWGGTDFLDFQLLEKLKKSQISALKEAIKNIKPNSATLDSKISDKLPRKMIESSQEKMNPKIKNSEIQINSENKNSKMNSEESSEKTSKVDVLSQIGVDENWIDAIYRGKWRERSEALLRVTECAKKAKNLKSGPFTAPFVEALGFCLKDQKAMIVITALKTLTPFARGLGKNFAVFAKKLFLEVLFKFKDNKKAMEIQCREALSAFVES